MDSSPSVSFIGIVDFTEDACWVYCSDSVTDLLGFEPRELLGRPSLELVHPDEFAQVRGIHYSTITQDQAAVLAYLRMRHKDPCKGYVLCAISRTVCQNVLVGSVSYASPGPKAMHNASTAQEVTIITPTAKDFEFRRWNDPNPMPPCPVPAHLLPSPPASNTYPEHFDPLPEQSVRTALILNRFTINCTVQYVSNDSLLRTTGALGRSFFDFVARRDEQLVRSWIDVIKGWGVNERGQPSDGGFGYGKFTLLLDGRDSSERMNDPTTRTRAKSRAHTSSPLSTTAPRRGVLRDLTRERPPAELVVDAIFSAHSDGLMVILRQNEPSSPPSLSALQHTQTAQQPRHERHETPREQRERQERQEQERGQLQQTQDTGPRSAPAAAPATFTFPPPLPPPLRRQTRSDESSHGGRERERDEGRFYSR